MRRGKGTVLLALMVSFAAPAAELPKLGTVLVPFPPGPGKEVADHACLNCHSSDVARQQKLTEKQWTATVNKMIGWGAEVRADRKDELLRYLAANFGPGNDAFRPVAVQAIRTSR